MYHHLSSIHVSCNTMYRTVPSIHASCITIYCTIINTCIIYHEYTLSTIPITFIPSIHIFLSFIPYVQLQLPLDIHPRIRTMRRIHHRLHRRLCINHFPVFLHIRHPNFTQKLFHFFPFKPKPCPNRFYFN